jgi:hypothetical protein
VLWRTVTISGPIDATPWDKRSYCFSLHSSISRWYTPSSCLPFKMRVCTQPTTTNNDSIEMSTQIKIHAQRKSVIRKAAALLPSTSAIILNITHDVSRTFRRFPYPRFERASSIVGCSIESASRMNPAKHQRLGGLQLDAVSPW